MALLDFGSGSNEMVWMGEALCEGYVKEGQTLEVSEITRASDGRGFLIRCSDGDLEIFDYAWAKGKMGTMLAAIFANPELAADNSIQVKCQSKIKNAQLTAVESKGVLWNLGFLEDKEVLTRAESSGSRVRSLPKEKGASESQLTA